MKNIIRLFLFLCLFAVIPGTVQVKANDYPMAKCPICNEDRDALFGKYEKIDENTHKKTFTGYYCYLDNIDFGSPFEEVKVHDYTWHKEKFPYSSAKSSHKITVTHYCACGAEQSEIVKQKHKFDRIIKKYSKGNSKKHSYKKYKACFCGKKVLIKKGTKKHSFKYVKTTYTSVDSKKHVKTKVYKCVCGRKKYVKKTESHIKKEFIDEDEGITDLMCEKCHYFFDEY